MRKDAGETGLRTQ